MKIVIKHIENITTRAIGRQIEINGHIELNLYPHPEVIINDVFLANAKWGTEPTMISVGHGDFAINFWSLFSDTILLRRVRLNDVSVLLERNDHVVLIHAIEVLLFEVHLGVADWSQVDLVERLVNGA